MTTTLQLIAKLSEKNESRLCIGLDVDEQLISVNNGPLLFIEDIVDQTLDLVCAYKINPAFWQSRGLQGIEDMYGLISSIPEDIPIIYDGKLGDVGHSANKYARAVFEDMAADAVTLNPWIGTDAILPFTSYAHKLSLLLYRTSNPSAEELQTDDASDTVLDLALQYDNTGLVIGASRPDLIAKVRDLSNIFILIPGIGEQGGDHNACVAAARKENYAIAVSRGILYSHNVRDAAEAMRVASMEWRLPR